MILPQNIFVSNETHFAGEVAGSDLLQFLEDWLHKPIPAEVAHVAPGIRVQEIKISKLWRDDDGIQWVKVLVRHAHNPNSPSLTPEVKPVPRELSLEGFKKLKEHERLSAHLPPMGG